MKYSDTKAKKAAPEPATVVPLPPSAWNPTYEDRPTVEAAIGIRMAGHKELMKARAEAAKVAKGHPDAARFDEELIVVTLGVCLCDPNDARKPYFEMADEEVRRALTDDGIAHLWQEFERAKIETSPTRPEATDDDLGDLGAMLLTPNRLARSFAQLPLGAEARIRRLCAFVLDELRDAETTITDDT